MRWWFAISLALMNSAVAAEPGDYLMVCTAPCIHPNDGSVQPAGTVIQALKLRQGAESYAPPSGIELQVLDGREPYDPPKVSRGEFWARFTPEEQTSITKAAQADPALMAWLLGLQLAEVVWLNNPRVRDGVHALVAAGVLPADRETTIMQR